MNLLIKSSDMVLIGQSPPPLGLLYMAAMDEDTVVWDDVYRKEHLWNFMRANQPKVVGVQCYTAGRKKALQNLVYAKELGAVTVIGGPHAAVMRKQLEEMDFIDHIVMGDGEYAWEWIVEFYNNKNTHYKPTKVIRELISCLDQLPLPKWDAINLNDYPPDRINIVMGRGCDGQCTFCSAWWVNGKYRRHGYKWMLKHLQLLHKKGVRHLRWQDDCLTNSHQATLDLVSALSHFQFKCVGTTRVDKVSEQTIEALKGVGFYSLGFGIESGSQTILDKINKETDLEQAIQVRQWCKKYGIKFKALMMVGFPFETAETRKEDRAFRKRLKPDEWGSIGHIAVYPGTQLYREAKKRGEITDDYWLGDKPYYKYGG